MLHVLLERFSLSDDKEKTDVRVDSAWCRLRLVKLLVNDAVEGGGGDMALDCLLYSGPLVEDGDGGKEYPSKADGGRELGPCRGGLAWM